MRVLAAIALSLALAGAALAEAPERSPRPEPRTEPRAGSETMAEAAAEAAAPPRARPRPWVPRLELALDWTGRALAGRGAADRAGAPVAASGALAGALAGAMPVQAVRPSLDHAAALAATAARRPATVERASTSGVLAAPRPGARAAARLAAGVAGLAPQEALRPRARPAAFVRPANPARNVPVVQPATRLAVLRSPRPAARPENHERRSVVLASAMIPTQPAPGAIIGRRGTVCGDPRLQGQTVSPIAGRVQGCGVENPVRITEVGGVRLSQAATVDCTTASALADWVEGTVKPTVGRLGGGVAGLQVFAHYACRPRNNQRGARISEHGRGRAIDIGAIVLANGAAISVLDHWRDDRLGPLLKAMHRGACGRFGTVLGPQADRFHQNHFHLDTARYRSGAYCR